MGFRDKIKHGWNAFIDYDRKRNNPPFYNYGSSFESRPDKIHYRYGNERTLMASLVTRIAVDCAQAEIKHCRIDDNDQFLESIDSGLNECLNISANIDQAGTAFRLDMYYTLLKEGVIAIVPVDTTLNPDMTGGFDIKTLRVGKILEFFSDRVRISLYNEKEHRRQDIILPKAFVGIVENPFYEIMNQPNSTLQRLIRKLNFLDSVDEAASSGRLDLIIQLPYVVRTETKQAEAERRLKSIELQLKNSSHGIAYTDATEKITQLNRPVENNMLSQIKFLTEKLYNEMGLSENVFNGTADEATMLNYNVRTVQPLVQAVVEEMKRKFLTKTARTRKQSMEYFRDPFKYVPISQIAEIGDKLARNEVLTANELRGIMGFKPSSDPKANELRNSNMPLEEPMELTQVNPGDIPVSQLSPGQTPMKELLP